MSFPKEKRNAIKHYILEQIENNNDEVVKKVVDVFGITATSVYRYIREMEEEGILSKKGHKYSLITKNKSFLYEMKDIHDEMQIMKRDLEPIISECPDNVHRIWTYCLSEMINNVLDHSEAQHFVILLNKTYMSTTFIIADDGIGIFKKIKDYYEMSSLDEAISELFKGKLTTDKVNHSGEGIFFSSNAMDIFAAISDGKVFTRNKYEEVNIENQLSDWNSEKSSLVTRKGTIIMMKLSNFSTKSMARVMDKFSNVENGFYKTSIPIKNIFDDYPVSRSQAKRLVRRFDNFKEIVLDFEGVSDAGQGFMHELFVVFGRSHPEIKLVPVHMNRNVKRMVSHVLNTK